MWRDFDDWGDDKGDTAYVVEFSRDRYIGPKDAGDLRPFLDPQNYVAETRYIYLREEIVADTLDIRQAARFYQPHQAAGAIQLHREHMGDVGRLYEITTISV